MGEPEIKPSVGDTMSANSQEGVGGALSQDPHGREVGG